MTRRRFFKLAALSLAGLALPKFVSSPLRADTIFSEVFGDVGLATHWGRLHLLADPNAKTRGRALVGELGQCRPSAWADHLSRRRQEDLASLKIVTVDGWVMARSEADLCALVHLDRSRA